MKYFVNLLISGFAVVIIANLLPGVTVKSLSSAIWIAFVLSLLNLLVKPALILLTLPLTVFTLGFFLLIINAIIINIADVLLPGFMVDGFFSSILFGLFLSVLQSVLYAVFGLKK